MCFQAVKRSIRICVGWGGVGEWGEERRGNGGRRTNVRGTEIRGCSVLLDERLIPRDGGPVGVVACPSVLKPSDVCRATMFVIPLTMLS